MDTKSRPMKMLPDFQKIKYGTPPSITDQHATRRPLDVAPIFDSIFSPSTNPQGGVVTGDTMHDQDIATDVNNDAFEIGKVVAFRGTDGLPFNLPRVTHDDPESAGTSELKLHEMMTTFAIPSISECETQETFVYQDRRQRRGKGNRYTST